MQTAFFSSIQPQERVYPVSNEYVLHWARNPEPGSEFYRLTAGLMQLPDGQLIEEMRAQRYDMFLAYEPTGILGHFALQEHEDGLHVFSVATDPTRRKISPFLVLDLAEAYLDAARTYRGAKRTKISNGNKRMVKLLGLLSRKEEELGISVDMETCWVNLYR